MNKTVYYCPKCNAEQKYYSNPYYIHICTNCKATCHRDQLIIKTVDIEQLIEEFQSCYYKLSNESYNQILQILKQAKERI